MDLGAIKELRRIIGSVKDTKPRKNGDGVHSRC